MSGNVIGCYVGPETFLLSARQPNIFEVQGGFFSGVCFALNLDMFKRQGLM